MTRAVTLIFVLIGSMVERSYAVSCYNCSDSGQTCPDPFLAASVPTCNGAVCDILTNVFYDGVTGQPSYSYFTRKCIAFATLPILDKCPTTSEPYNQVNFTYFTYGSSCCYSQRIPLSYGVSYFINCQCKADNCNGDIPPLLTLGTGKPQSTTTQRIPNAGNPPSTAGNRISSAGFSPQPFSKLSIVFVAMIAVLSIIRWYI